MVLFDLATPAPGTYGFYNTNIAGATPSSPQALPTDPAVNLSIAKGISGSGLRVRL